MRVELYSQPGDTLETLARAAYCIRQALPLSMNSSIQLVRDDIRIDTDGLASVAEIIAKYQRGGHDERAA
jgi:hypothetical protein